MTNTAPQALVIGASAGAVEALSAILTDLPVPYRLPIIVVVHIPPDKTSALAELFCAKCRNPVREADDKEPIVNGTIYFAPPNYHLLVENDRTLALSNEEPVLYSRPSIDVLFESAADAYGPALIAIVLTGANEDGATGLKSVVEAGGAAIVQRPYDAFASAMPEAALLACPDARVLGLDKIALYLNELHRM